ncbi:hypothetical protein HOP52_04255 [Halomonas campisalis]|uniref:Photosynthesis system II assembly factor Ycf48/Hcf136-like domain-containing protein n=2 Tax=Billgrantia campisalis TaxID=74661 RepID=A0ABS9P5D4_9GAMM|nr:YCF48-related protein [Halomonas campisalis]MCG6656990.1 hypothetical protein [Halomonas campisalis]
MMLKSPFCRSRCTLWHALRLAHLALCCLLAAPHAMAQSIEDPLVAAAMPSSLTEHSLLLDVTRAGERLIAVGERGHILYSDDEGKSWHQALVPVRVTLTAVDFPTPRHGWAVGHEGVILHSEDGGESWTKQLDGHEVNRIVNERARSLLDAAEAQAHGDERLAVSLDDLVFLYEESEAFLDEGPSRPLLDVSFHDERTGLAVGAFGLFLETRDGGNTWQSLLGHLDNPYGLHLNHIARFDDTLIIAGEAGSLFRSWDGGAHWETLSSPYEGSFFGALGDPEGGQLFVFGLRGHLYRSVDKGDSWEPIRLDTDTTLTGATLLADGTPLLVGYGGTILTGSPAGNGFTLQMLADRRAYSAVTGSNDGHLILVGQGGVRRIPQPASL